ERYARWALGVPVMFVLRGDAWVRMGDRTFAEFMKSGHPEAGTALHEDWVLHLTALFPEVRLKQHIEVRGADSVPAELVGAVVALWRGLLHDERAGRAIDDLTRDWSREERLTMHESAGRVGLAARVGSRTLRELALEVLDLAEAGLAGQADDAALLAPFRRIAESGESPAALLLRDWSARGPSAILERA